MGLRSGPQRVVRAAFVSLLLAGVCTAVSSHAAAAAVPACRTVQVPVALTAGAPANAFLAGQICYPTTDVPALRGVVQVLVSGTAYGQSYWDFPYQPDTYSYVRAAAQAGYTTFNFDRIGIGASTHPLSTEVSIPSNAYTIHQAISQLRSGSLDGTRYSSVVIVGHSLGSLIAWYEAGTYHDVDAVVASGILHSFNALGVSEFLATLYPAALDPRFVGRIVDPGYLTTLPGTRESSFYYPPNTDPAVVATDESLKETATAPEALGVFAQELPGTLQPLTAPLCELTPQICDGIASSTFYGITRQINVPVLEVVGQYDKLLCGGPTGSNACSDVDAVRDNERTYFSGIAQRCLTVAELPDSGHDVNLERNAQSWFSLANSWTAFTLGSDTDGEGACWSSTSSDGMITP
jgi:pimeloyl-ACP methyl ester carboxylesterase